MAAEIFSPDFCALVNNKDQLSLLLYKTKSPQADSHGPIGEVPCTSKRENSEWEEDERYEGERFMANLARPRRLPRKAVLISSLEKSDYEENEAAYQEKGRGRHIYIIIAIIMITLVNTRTDFIRSIHDGKIIGTRSRVQSYARA